VNPSETDNLKILFPVGTHVAWGGGNNGFTKPKMGVVVAIVRKGQSIRLILQGLGVDTKRINVEANDKSPHLDRYLINAGTTGPKAVVRHYFAPPVGAVNKSGTLVVKNAEGEVAK
jgi:hypothetical protein